MLSSYCRREKSAGFTLIELLIVIAIILILIAIAMPNFLEAQNRAKVAKSEGDLRSLATAMEMYHLDHKKYPRDSDSSLDILGSVPLGLRADGAIELTTPNAYLQGLLSDPFSGDIKVQGGGAIGYRIGSGSWSYASDGDNPQDNQMASAVFGVVGKQEAFVAIGVGPDQARSRNAYKCFPYMSLYEGGASVNPPSTSTNQPAMYLTYSPTNGSKSLGDLYYFGGSWRGGRFMLDGQVIGKASSPGGPVW
jgi:type II secretion system protein G